MGKEMMIKVFDKKIANSLIDMGFHCVYEKINNEIVYCFEANEPLMDLLSKQYTKKDFFFENKLRF